jgi:hypothetical protein
MWALSVASALCLILGITVIGVATKNYKDEAGLDN